ncbi:MAG: DUF1559 domain-containing protein, partial [Planctomycetaceae bacterium]
LPAVQAARESSRRSSCGNNLKQVGLGVDLFVNTVRRLPPGYVSGAGVAGSDTGPGWGWAAFILPHVEQAVVAGRIDITQPIEAVVSSAGREAVIPAFLCPSDPGGRAAFAVGPRDSSGTLTTPSCRVGPSNYVGCFGIGEPGIDGEGVFYRGSDVRPSDITDGLSHTLLAGERSFRDAASTWVGAVTGAHQVPEPTCRLGLQINNASNFVLAHTGESYAGPTGATEINNFTSAHFGGCMFVFVDGHVSFLGSRVSYDAYKALSTRAKGDAVAVE